MKPLLTRLEYNKHIQSLPSAVVTVLFDLYTDTILKFLALTSMGRAKPSQQVLDFAAAFARAVTAQSASICDFVARSGDFSLYALLGRLAPKVNT